MRLARLTWHARCFWKSWLNPERPLEWEGPALRAGRSKMRGWVGYAAPDSSIRLCDRPVIVTAAQQLIRDHVDALRHVLNVAIGEGEVRASRMLGGEAPGNVPILVGVGRICRTID